MKKPGIMILTMLLLGSISIFSQPANKGQFGGQRGERLKALLKLTPEQEKKFTDLKYAQQQAAIDIKSKIQKNQLEMKKMISDGKIDEKKILQLTDENSKLQGDLKNSAVKNMLAAYNILNDEQRVIFTKHLPQIMAAGKMKGKIKSWMMNRMNRNGRGMMNQNRMMNRGGMMNNQPTR
ncbi:MAG: hypothetical protein CVV24_10620 [Ignavibacteriae bacterium HGW-Ignavibacteriae-3]|nr:MAG: hypothetical protein CVV24_10620 [Ignavibacteriae bacterium HGW-Ignavibacteriae-3]